MSLNNYRGALGSGYDNGLHIHLRSSCLALSHLFFVSCTTKSYDAHVVIMTLALVRPRELEAEVGACAVAQGAGAS